MPCSAEQRGLIAFASARAAGFRSPLGVNPQWDALGSRGVG
jgi:hypothetical protein